MTDESEAADMTSSRAKFHRPPFPVGWFAVARIDDLTAGVLEPLTAFGQDLAIGRVPPDKALVVHSTCPHLGANIAHGGRIDGEQVVCPLHEWCFDHDGLCVSAAGGIVPEELRLRVWPTEVVDRTVWVFHGRRGELSAGPPPVEMPSRATSRDNWAAHPEDLLVGSLEGLGAVDGPGAQAVWKGETVGGTALKVLGPGILVVRGPIGKETVVTLRPVDGFTVLVEVFGQTPVEVLIEKDRSIFIEFRNWYRQFDSSGGSRSRSVQRTRDGSRRVRRSGA